MKNTRMLLVVVCCITNAVINAKPAWEIMPEWMGIQSKVVSAYYKAGNTRSPATLGAGSAFRLAMFTAANAAQPTYHQYLTGMPQAQGADPVLAAGFAAAKALELLYGDSGREAVSEKLMAEQKGHTQAVIDSSRQAGEQAAQLAVERGRMMVEDKYPHYLPQTSAGVYISGRLPAFAPWFLDRKPWFLSSRDAIRPEAPPALDSDQWARDFNEVKSLGGKNSSQRTEQQSKEAVFWQGMDNEAIIDQAAQRRSLSFVDIARIYAMMSMSTDDSFLAVVEAKYHYNFWRPITAIRRAELDNNPATEVDAGWEPYRNTPNHPEYPCAHCQYGSGTAAILEGTMPRMDDESFKVYETDKPDDFIVIKHYNEFEKRMSDSRIYYGAHYRTSNEVGEKMGRQVAKIALDSFALPLKE